MIHSTRIQGSSGLATALKDRSTCSIPVQPNRSLLVRPAPHIPCRAIVSKKMTTDQPASNTVNIPTSSILPSLQGTLTSTSISSQMPSSSPSLSSSSSQSLMNNVPQQYFRCTLDLTKIDVPNLQNASCKSIINIVEAKKCNKKNNQNISKRLGTKRKPDNGYNKKSYPHHFIDITKSPERHGVDDLYSTIHANNNNTTDNECKRNGETIGKKRRKKGKKSDDEETNKLKIPPLRLKKIQNLQDSQTSYIGSSSEDGDSIKITENEKPLSVTTFRYYQSEDQDSRASEDIRPISKEHASKYRIVTGQTPPYDERIDSSTASNKDIKELRCHQNKLKLKLRELKKKTVELSRVMLKTALTSSCTPVKETIDSYSEQIEKLTNLLKMIPETAAQNNTDCEINKDIVKLSSQVLQNDTSVSPSFSTNNEKNISSFNSLASPEPPKLSPKITVDYGNTSPNQIRNSPPHLAIATSNNDNNCENDWENSELFRKFFKQGEDTSKPYSNTDTTDPSTITSPIITTTTGSIISEEINIEDKPEYFDLTLLEVPKTEVNNDIVQNNDDEGRDVGELNMQCEFGEVLKIDLRRSPSPEEIIIDTSNTFHSLNKINEDCDDNSSVKSLHIDVDYNEENNTNANEIRDKKKLPDNTSPIQSIITSSCNGSSEHPKNPSVENRGNGEIDQNIAMSNEFPTLGSWLAKISTKLRNQLSKNSMYDVNNSKQPMIVNNNNNNNDVYDQNHNFNQELPKKVINSATLKTNCSIESQIKHKQWPEPQQQPQVVQRAQNDNLIKSTPSISPSMHKKVPEVEQPAYPPQILMDRYYPRNYPMDLYRAPLMHPQNIPNGQLPDMQNGPKQYHMNSSVASMVNPMSMAQNTGLPCWHPTAPKTLQESKRAYPNIPLGYDPMALSKRAAYPQMHSMMSPMTTNFANQPFQQMHQQHQQRHPQQLHPSQQQQMQYDRMWQKPTMCLQTADAQIQPMNYPPPWRGPLLFGPDNLAASRSYGLNNNWTSDPCNLLSTLAPTALQNLATPYQAGPRVRNVKERVEQTRSCETPHLAKVTYSPNIAKTYACSNCGLRGPLFKCLGCEVAYYCDESCQARHWNRHVVVCPKKMPKLKKVVP